MNAASAFDRELLEAVPKVRRLALFLAKSHAAAEDLAQDTIERGLRYRDQFQLGTNMGAWLCFICRNTFLSERRRAWRMVEMAEGQAERVPAPANALHYLELEDLMTALAHIPAEQREALMAVGLQGEDYDTAAADLGVAVGTIKSRVSRGRAALDLWFGATTEGH